MSAIDVFADDYSWPEVFAYAGARASAQGATSPPQRVPGFEGSDAPFDLPDVARVIAHSEGENDGPDWVAVVELNDGRFGVVQAGCDYTGWDCRAGGFAWVAGSLDAIVQFGLGDQERSRLGLSIVEGT